MKTRFTLLAVLLTAYFTGFAQQPANGSFETWTNAYTPAGWVTTDDLIAGLLGPPASPTFVSEDLTTFTDGISLSKIRN